MLQQINIQDLKRNEARTICSFEIVGNLKLNREYFKYIKIYYYNNNWFALSLDGTPTIYSPRAIKYEEISPSAIKYNSILLHYYDIMSLRAVIKYRNTIHTLFASCIDPSVINIEQFYNGYHFKIDENSFFMYNQLPYNYKGNIFFPEYVCKGHICTNTLLNSGMKIPFSFCTSIEGVERTELLIGDKTISLYPSGPAGSLMYFNTIYDNTIANALMLNIEEIGAMQGCIIYLENGLTLFNIKTFSDDISSFIGKLYEQSKAYLERGYIMRLGPIIDHYNYMLSLLSPYIDIYCFERAMNFVVCEKEMKSLYAEDDGMQLHGKLVGSISEPMIKNLGRWLGQCPTYSKYIEYMVNCLTDPKDFCVNITNVIQLFEERNSFAYLNDLEVILRF